MVQGPNISTTISICWFTIVQFLSLLAINHGISKTNLLYNWKKKVNGVDS